MTKAGRHLAIAVRNNRLSRKEVWPPLKKMDPYFATSAEAAIEQMATSVASLVASTETIENILLFAFGGVLFYFGIKLFWHS